MRERIRSHLSYANVTATLALFLVISGGTAAAVTYVVSSNGQIGPGTVSGHKPPTGKHANVIAGSVNGTDLANGAVTSGKLASNSVTGGKVVDGSLLAEDTDTASIQKRLDAGCASGQAIASVDASGTSSCTAVGFTQVTMRLGFGTGSGAGAATASCQAGETVVGGGGEANGVALVVSEPAAVVTPGSQGWRAGSEAGSVTAYALCAK